MKFLNDFKNLFAILGVVSIIFWTCSAESSSDDNSSNLPPQITDGYGKYQVSMSDTNFMVILNTETGVIKSYYWNSSSGAEWTEGNYYNSNLSGSGNLTANH